MNTLEIQEKIVDTVRRINDNKFLLYLYEMLEAKTSDPTTKDILDELNQTQRNSILNAIDEAEGGKGIAHPVAIQRLRDLLK